MNTKRVALLVLCWFKFQCSIGFIECIDLTEP